MKATEQCFRMVLLTTLYKAVLTLQPLDKTLECDHSDESYWTVLSLALFIIQLMQGSSSF